MAHKPGPWQLGDPKFDGKGFRKVEAPLWHPIAQVIKRQSRKDEDAANARLIAAAPELLEAAKHARQSFARNGLATNYADVMLEAAIAKAEGTTDAP